MIDPGKLGEHNQALTEVLQQDYDSLGTQLERGGIDIEAITAAAAGHGSP